MGTTRTVCSWMQVATFALAAVFLFGSVRAELRTPHGATATIGPRDYVARNVPVATYAKRDAEAFRRAVVEVPGFDPENATFLRDAPRPAQPAVEPPESEGRDRGNSPGGIGAGSCSDRFFTPRGEHEGVVE